MSIYLCGHLKLYHALAHLSSQLIRIGKNNVIMVYSPKNQYPTMRWAPLMSNSPYPMWDYGGMCIQCYLM